MDRQFQPKPNKVTPIKPGAEVPPKARTPYQESGIEPEGAINVDNLTTEQLVKAIAREKVVITTKEAFQAELDEMNLELPDGRSMAEAHPGDCWCFNVSYPGYEKRVAYIQFRVLFVDGNNQAVSVDLGSKTNHDLRETMTSAGFKNVRGSMFEDAKKLADLEAVIETLNTRSSL